MKIIIFSTVTSFKSGGTCLSHKYFSYLPKKQGSMFEIRKATAGDIPLIRDLTFRVWPQTYASILTPEQIDYMLDMMYSENSLQKQITKDGCQFIIVYEEGNPVGFASYSEEAPQRWKLNKIYILQNQQGKGTGKYVINYIIEDIKKHNANSLFLQVNQHNRAKSFYERLGFKEVDFVNLDIGNGFFMNDYIMEKKI